MRTTLDIDEDILTAAKDIAHRQRSSAGKVLSQLARRGLLDARHERKEEVFLIKNGIPVRRRTPGDKVVTLELVNKLRDELP